MRVAIADILFKIPIVREFLFIVQCKSVSSRSLHNMCKQGLNVFLNPGGIYEQVRTRHDQEKL